MNSSGAPRTSDKNQPSAPNGTNSSQDRNDITPPDTLADSNRPQRASRAAGASAPNYLPSWPILEDSSDDEPIAPPPRRGRRLVSRASQVQGGDSGVSAGDQALRLARVENVGAATGVVGAAQEEAAKANQEASVIKKEAKQEIKKEAKQGDKLETSSPAFKGKSISGRYIADSDDEPVLLEVRQRRDGLHVVSDDDDDDSRVVVNLDDIARRYSIVSEGSLRQKNAGSKNQQDKAWVKVKREAPQSAAARKRPFPTSSVTSSEVAKRLKTTPPGAAGTISKYTFALKNVLVTITTGGFSFQVPVNLLRRSPRFQRWLDDEQEAGSAQAPYWAQQFETDIFAIWLAFASTGSIQSAAELLIIDDQPRLSAGRLRNALTEKCLQLIKLYLLGDELQDVQFKNHVMDNIVAHLHQETLKFEIKNFNRAAHLAYSSTTRYPRGMLRRVISEFIFTCAKAEDLSASNNSCTTCKGRCEHLEQIGIDLGVIGMRMAKHRMEGPFKPWEQPKCSYHDHDEAFPMNACQ